ncbi:threonine aldolase family protein [Burkholderia stabilis]|nr:threonine aldolase family protein [Burkholderia stabilis]
MKLIDLFSDTKSEPTEAMRAAMAKAKVGDEQMDEDPTTRELCARVAEELGFEAAIFMPSGTMCNLVATLVHTRPGDELIADAQSHIFATESAGVAVIAGVSVNPIQTRTGIFTAEQCRNAIRTPARSAPRSAMVSIEQTTNISGGAVWPVEALHAVRDAAHDAGLRTHIDGARIFNASVAAGVPAKIFTSGWDSAWIDFSKGLGCPFGSVLSGNREFVRDAWTWKYRLGGAMRQSGIMAAAALYALDHHVTRLADDHDNATLLIRLLTSEPYFTFTPPDLITNILLFNLQGLRVNTSTFVEEALKRGVRVRALPDGRVRATTHLGVTHNDVIAAADVLIEIAREFAADAR